jgi:hypothetical protein
VAASAQTQKALAHGQEYLNHVGRLHIHPHNHLHRAILSAQAVHSHIGADKLHSAAAHVHDHAAISHGSGQQHDFHTQEAAHHRAMSVKHRTAAHIVGNHHTAAQVHHHARRQLVARSGLFDGLEIVTLD